MIDILSILGHSYETVRIWYDSNEAYLKEIDPYDLTKGKQLQIKWNEWFEFCAKEEKNRNIETVSKPPIISLLPPATSKRQRMAITSNIAVSQVPISSQIHHISSNQEVLKIALSLLKKIFPSVTVPSFTCTQQKDLVLFCLNVLIGSTETKDSLFIMPTGSGKSLSWIISALYLKMQESNRIIVVVAPTRSLLYDIHSTCDLLGILVFDRSYFDRGNVSGLSETGILLLSPEDAIKPEIRTVIETLGDRIKLVVVDEFQQYGIWDDFRSGMMEFLHMIATVEAVQVYLSGSIHPELVRSLEIDLKSPGISVHRASTLRDNIYHIRHELSSNSDFIGAAAEVMDQILPVFNGSSEYPPRIIAYCNTITEIDQLYTRITFTFRYLFMSFM